MSTLDQPILIANSNYHVGHQIAIFTVVAIVTSPDRLESWALPVDGGIAPEAVQRIADEMVKSGKLSRPMAAKDILRDAMNHERISRP